MVDDEALVPAVEVFVRVDLDSELLQHGLVGSLAHGVHGGAHVVQDAHDARRILGWQKGTIHTEATDADKDGSRTIGTFIKVRGTQ